MLEISLVVNFILIGVLLYLHDRNDRLKNSLDLVSDNRIYGGKTAWYQFNYVVHSYIHLRKKCGEWEAAHKELWADVQAKDPILTGSYENLLKHYKEDRKVFSREWKDVKFPDYGLKEIGKLLTEFDNAKEVKNEWNY